MARLATAIRAARDCRLPYLARTFDVPPGPAGAAALLDDIANAAGAAGPVADDRPLALYGGGNLGRLARDHLTCVGREVAFVVDRAAEALAGDPAWRGVPVLAPAAVPEQRRREVRLAVSVVTTPYVPLAAALAADGFADVVPFYDVAESFRHLHPLSNGWFAPPLTAQDRDGLAAVLARWDDDVSRAHHLQFLAWRRLREEWSFAGAPVVGDDRFFIPEVVRTLRPGEVFLDGGAHHGEVSERFLRVAGAAEAIVAIEPDPLSGARLIETLRRLGAVATVYDCALAEAEGEALFHDGLDYASQLSPTGRMRVMRARIDDLDAAPSVVKLHLEGGELPALIGARATLLRQRPIVAATVYHNADGLWRTPQWLMQTLPDYRFLFRAHSWCGTGAVVYAIPNEREA